MESKEYFEKVMQDRGAYLCSHTDLTDNKNPNLYCYKLG